MTRSRINADQARTESLNVVPHIIPDVLHPAIEADATGAGKLLDGTTEHGTGTYGGASVSTSYGTVQTDGRKYYFTNIAGSKPIKDPRIGSHFGSQRHQFTSAQLLEQETATYGKDVYSVDGREWCRFVNGSTSSTVTSNNSYGAHLEIGSSSIEAAGDVKIEVVGYFNFVNLMTINNTDHNNIRHRIDGGSWVQNDIGSISVTDPKVIPRFVHAGSLSNLSIGSFTTPAIHTIEIENYDGSNHFVIESIELIAQDTTSTATKSQIQIPSQNVVSYGKKFTVAETKHYNPFAYKTDGTTVWASGAHNGTAWPIGTGSSANIDTATSLGLAAWVSTNYYKPYNGGRVVRWVDSSGVIKTSVNMMPPNAKSIKNADITKKANASIANDTYLPTFESGAIDHSLAEVAKTFHYREFGNGAANGGTEGTYADASMLNGADDDFAYVMDDGLTSLSGNAKVNEPNMYRNNASSFCFLTFIGTGILKSVDGATPTTIAQNLPYGTHIFYQDMGADADHADWHIDGVQVQNERDNSNGTDQEKYFEEMSIFQPKMPPIPQDAVIISDYMLMADFVAQTTSGPEQISKGVRKVSCSRDVFYDETDGDSFALALATIPEAFTCTLGGTADNATSAKSRISVFGTNYVHRGYQSAARSVMYIADTVQADAVLTKGAATPDVQGSYQHLTSSLTVGSYTWGINAKTGQNGTTGGFDIVTPIHTSSHYQSFETPYLHELVGGDRNMEQTNLVVTPDGKTWDEVTRDVGYIGNIEFQATASNSEGAWAGNATTPIYFDEFRGLYSASNGGDHENWNKNWAIAYDRFICLKDGSYEISIQMLIMESAQGMTSLYKNGQIVQQSHPPNHSNVHLKIYMMHADTNVRRGDYFQMYGQYHGDDFAPTLTIKKI